MKYQAAALIRTGTSDKNEPIFTTIVLGNAEVLEDGLICVELVALPAHSWSGRMFLSPIPETT